MDERKKYNAVSIPPRGTLPADKTSAASRGLSGVGSSADTLFAEVEIGGGRTAFGASRMAGGASTIGVSLSGSGASGPAPAARPQPVGQRDTDPIRQKIYDMRSLAAGNPFAMRDAELFYKQAKYMEDFADDFGENESLSMYYPCYQLMGYKQLRTYFTWRSAFRRGEIRRTSLSYLFLYTYEVLCNIGVNGPADGLLRLTALWEAYHESEPALENYLPRWFKDYHIYYGLYEGFPDFVGRYALWKHYPEFFAVDAGAEESLALWNRISGYDVTKSNFYNAGNEDLFRGCFYAVLTGVRALCDERDIRFEDLLLYRASGREATWYPFPRAMFYPWLRQADRQVDLPGGETYYCKDNRWTANLSIYYAGRKEFVGYLIRKTEERLRLATGYKYKISADHSAAWQSIKKLKALGISFADLNGAIERSVADFHRDINRTVVVVNQDNLARIREEALGTQSRLIVPEGGGPQAPGAAEPTAAEPTAAHDEKPAQTVEATRGAAAEDQAGWFGPAAEEEPFLPSAQAPAPAEQPPEPAEPFPLPADLASDGWAALREALDDVERQALSLVLLGGEGVRTFADEHGLMLEVLADSINEKSADLIGDALLETDDGMTIYSEYIDKVMEMVGSV